MSGMRKAAAVALVAVTVLGLSGCSTGPSREEVADRYLLEFEAAFGMGDTEGHFDEVVETYVADMFDAESCGSSTYRTTAFPDGSPQFRYAFEQTCLMYFEGQMSDSQIREAKLLLIGG